MSFRLSEPTNLIFGLPFRGQERSGYFISTKKEEIARDFSHKSARQTLKNSAHTFVSKNLFGKTPGASRKKKKD